MIAVIGGPKIHELGYLYAQLAGGRGQALVMLTIALLVNNLPAK